MKKMLLLCGALLVMSASVASALDNLNLGWNTCFGDGGTNLQTFACTANGTALPLVASVTPGQDYLAFNGFDAIIYTSTTGQVPAWWGNACTPAYTKFTVSPNTLCAVAADPYSNSATGAGGGIAPPIDYTVSGGTAVKLRVAFAVPAGTVPPSEMDLVAGQEYFTCVVNVARSRVVTVGTALACAGCATPACINFLSCTLGQIGGVATFITHGGPQQQIFWQSATQSCTGATPTRKSTWGSVKALYR